MVEMQDRISFRECVLRCYDDKELVAEFNRLTGSSLGIDRRSAIERGIDLATGHDAPDIDDREAERFIGFVLDCIWLRLETGRAGAVAMPREGCGDA